jgi:GTP-binding protein HflX
MAWPRRSLAAALPNLEVLWAEVVRLPKLQPGTLFGSGKVAELKARIAADAVDLVLIDGPVSPVQQRNLEKEWGVKLLDRTSLILEIFADRARTREGVLQVELAALSYQRSRLVRAWTHLERQRGGFGFVGGPGETQIEADRRAIDDQVMRLKRQLDRVVKTRELHRAARAKVPFPIVALVGYTNAGKSTLFNRVTGRRGAGQGHAVRHAGPDDARRRAAIGAQGSSCPTPWASSRTCRPSWSPPSAPRWRRCSRPI